MLELHQFARHWGLPNASPPCMKVESYLRLANIEYKTVVVGDPGKGPYGKAPWVIDDGKTIPDSRFIIEYLNRKHGYPLKGDLSEVQLADHHAIGRMLDESTYWVMVYERWITEENAPITRDTLLGFIPNPMRKMVFAIARRGVKKALHGQGTGRLSPEEINTLGKNDIDVLARVLGDKPFFAGDEPAEIDATTYAYVANFITPPFNSTVNDYMRSSDNLSAYNDRMRERLFPEITA